MPTGIYNRNGYKHSEKTKRKIGLKHNGKILSEKTLEKISLGHIGVGKGKKQSLEHIRKAIEGRKGFKHSEETKRKQSLLMEGRRHPQSEETKKKISIANTGRKHSPDGIERSRQANIGKKMSVEFRKKMSEYMVLHPIKIFKDTSIELKVEAELQKRGIMYNKQVPLCKVTIADFYLPDSKIVIQCDGCYWHGCPIHCPYKNEKVRIRDMNQDAVLESNGFHVYRLWEHEINKSIEECINKILTIK
jgi:DNA mismatch endonuclease (patch repair protein)